MILEEMKYLQNFLNRLINLSNRKIISEAKEQPYHGATSGV